MIIEYRDIEPCSDTIIAVRNCLKNFRIGLVTLIFLHAASNVFGQVATDTSGADETTNHRNIITRFFEQQARVQYIYGVVLNPSATSIAWNADDGTGSTTIYRTSLSHPDRVVRVSAVVDAGNTKLSEREPQWSPDGNEIAFFSDAHTPGQAQVYIVSATTANNVNARPLTQFDGYVSHLKWSADGNYLSVLYVEKASREPSPMAAENRAVGLIDSLLNRNVQRIAVINRLTGQTRQVTPPGLYIFEYDWSPDSRKFVYTAALPPGDDNWYIARLYLQSRGGMDSTLLYTPLRQIALPRWSPDGKRIAFIEGLMSDQGGTGGEIFIIPSTGGNILQNLTPNRAATPSWFTWRSNNNILFTEFVGGSVAINTLSTSKAAIKNIWKADESIRAGSEEMSLAVAGSRASPTLAFIRVSWNRLPEVWSGNLNNWYGNLTKLTQVTRLNTGMADNMPKAENIAWTNEGQKVQGWLLYPDNYNANKHYPMLVCVHGGPAWITTPTWSAPDFNTTVYTQLGYFVFFPNPRGSYGQGEAFTLANRRDWGFGDLRDIITGVDSVIAKFPVDNNRIGIFGWSYGGATSMFAVTQTKRFRAAVAGAGAADWLSYYGQNSIDKWMWSYFGTSPYDDPGAYAKSSAMTYIKNTTTPTLILVGERDGEAPAPQSFQFWHALKELQVPTQLMVYPGEGHSFEKLENRIDVCARTIEWFNTFMKP
ncbi:MAG: peptidase (acylaminoacyl-peptidase) family [Chitinophagaceae bacterium]|nr:peptidase (acylaminoacyl-peptidase) family [Chitinophagaceae bacterium]